MSAAIASAIQSSNRPPCRSRAIVAKVARQRESYGNRPIRFTQANDQCPLLYGQPLGALQEEHRYLSRGRGRVARAALAMDARALADR